ncbi:MAG: glycine--tRNA ligase [Candidatus Pacearchaeota archaeon]|jgi:glycyl-tRNA synthetase
MYIVKQKVNGGEYYYLRKAVRNGKKVTSECVAYLGKTLEGAEMKKKEIEEKLLKQEGKGNVMAENQNNNNNEKTMVHKSLTIDELAIFCKRKGFVYPSGELYGGLGGFWDFGHLGVELKKNLKESWWKYHVYRDDLVGIDGSIITNPKVWEASGHVGSFVDVAVVCKKCKNKTKIDKHEVGKAKCDKCGGEFENKGEFNPMFVTQVGPVKDDSVKAYLRPETAQLIFADFKLIQENARMQLPFGIAQVGKSFRNEISPREFLFRSREFEQMEIEYFIEGGTSCPYMEETKGVNILVYDEHMQKAGKEAQFMDLHEAWKKGVIKTDWHAYWITQEYNWFLNLGCRAENFRIRQHCSDEKSHYAIDTWDLEYKFPMGWRELQGFANRGNFDLTQHQNYSKQSMEIMNKEQKKVLPHVVCEPSLGVERAFLVFLFEAYSQNEKGEVVLKLNPKLAPIKAAVFPIVKSEEYEAIAEKILKDLRKDWNIIYDKSGSIGRRYARNDEAGTPYCITIDDKSPSQKDITIRDRDTREQIRVKIIDLKETIRKLINGEIEFLHAGKRV